MDTRNTDRQPRTYIHQFPDDLASSRSDAIVADEALADLVAYLTSSKFTEDTTVQVADVLARIAPVRSALGYASTACPYEDADECATAREHAVAGCSDRIPDCAQHGAFPEAA